MVKLYYAKGACSLAPHLALEWIGAPFEAQRVAVDSKELLSLNPAGAVPVLDDDGFILTQAGAILHYLARKHPEAGLGGDGSIRDEAEIDRWLSFFTGDLHPSFYPLFMAGRYTTDPSEASLAAVRAAGMKLVQKRLALLDAQLKGRDYILGRRSIVDAYAFPMLRWAAAKLPEGLKPYPNVLALHDRIAADPAAQRVLAREAQ